MLGKTVALASSSRIATYETERARELEERIDFARDIHDGVVQRLFGVSLALSVRAAADRGGAGALRGRGAARRSASCAPRCSVRSGARRPRPARRSPPSSTASAPSTPTSASRVEGEVSGVPHALEPLAQSVLTEAVRNARKHADPTSLRVRTHSDDSTFVLEIENDGVPALRSASTGVGLRLAALEALQAGGLVEFGEREPGTWQVRLVVPIPPRAAA